MSDVRLSVISLAARGFGGGDPERILQMSVDLYVDVSAWVSFERDYAMTKAHLNKPEQRK